MNYELHYNKLIDRARSRILPSDIYVENHHILPRCMGGDDSSNNMVYLTAEEHLLAHLLLTKIYSYEGLLLALRHMLLPSSTDCAGRTSFNKKYGRWRRKLSDHLKQMKWWHKGDKMQRAKECPGIDWEKGMGIIPWNKGKPHTEERKAKQSNIMVGRAQPLKSDEARANSGHKGHMWWTDGINNKRAIDCPAMGWYKGYNVKTSGSTGMHWWNNGIDNIFARICPDGYIKGRLSK